MNISAYTTFVQKRFRGLTFFALLFVIVVNTFYVETARSEETSYSLACTFTASAWLKWQNRRWNSMNFEPYPPFRFIIRDGAPKIESAPVWQLRGLKCIDLKENDYLCYNSTGTALFFNLINRSGAVAQLFGSSRPPIIGDRRDTIGVEPFDCVVVR